MSSNPHLVKEGDIEIDSRMSPQLQQFVRNSLRTLRPSQLASVPIEVLRHAKDAEYNEVLKREKFNNLDGYKEITIKNPTDGYEIPCWVFKPTDAKKDAPIVVYFHGGGWIGHSPFTHYYPCGLLSSKSKMVFIVVDYRLAPENKYKTQLTDYRAVMDWVSKNKEKFSSKDAKLGVMGNDAGGQIAALMGHHYKSVLDFQVMIYPTLDLANTSTKSFREYGHETYLLPPEVFNLAVFCYLEDLSTANSPDVSPIYKKDFSKMPKSLVVAAEFDPVFDSNKEYHEKLLQGNNHSEFKVVKRSIHGFILEPFKQSESFGECIDYCLQFLAKI